MKKEFVFGTIRGVHEIGDVLVNEAERDGEISFHTFVKANDGWKDTRHAWPTLPQAVTFGFAWNAFANANEAKTGCGGKTCRCSASTTLSGWTVW